MRGDEAIIRSGERSLRGADCLFGWRRRRCRHPGLGCIELGFDLRRFDFLCLHRLAGLGVFGRALLEFSTRCAQLLDLCRHRVERLLNGRDFRYRLGRHGALAGLLELRDFRVDRLHGFLRIGELLR